jgi:hypothetical protein
VRGVKKTNVILALLLGAAIALLNGCKDNPHDAAVKKLQQDTVSVLETLSKDDDLTAANDQMRSLLISASEVSSEADASLLAAADLQTTKAQQDRASLPLAMAEINRNTEAMDRTLRQLADLASQLGRTGQLIALAGTEITELEKWIGSEQEPNSLKGKIVTAQKEEKDLLAQKETLDKEFAENHSKMLAIEDEADEKLRQAQRAEGDQRMQMENAAFDLLAGKKEYTLKAQAAENALSVVNSQLAIVQPHLQRIENDLKTAETKLQGLKTSPSHDALAAQQLQITTDIDTQKATLTSQVETLKTQFAAHNSNIDAIIESADQALGNYQRVNSRDLNYILSMVMGQTYNLTGSLYATKLYNTMDFEDRLSGIFRAYEQVLPSSLASSIASEPNVQPIVQKAYEYFDQAASAYEQAYGSSSMLGGDSKAAELAAIKGQVLSLNDKLRMADRIKDFQAAEKTQTDLNAVLEKAKEFGIQFSQSATAMLLSKGLDYVPQLPVNTAMIFEGIKKEFADWRQINITEMEAEINKLLPRIAALKAEYAGDQQIISFLDQEQAAMEEQKTKGFTEETADANALETETGDMSLPQQPL